jgi:3-hydroxy acid dehydrogenase / malonic semialdehyde reductase
MNQTVFITGASSGFGAAAARLFAAQGDRLVLAARRFEPLERLRDELRGSAEVQLLQLDVRDRRAVEAAINSLSGDFQKVDILLNNAGLALGLEPSHQVDLDDWETMIDTNIKGLTYCTRFLLPGMVERRRGHVINLGSTAGSWPYPGGNVYGGTKAFVEQFSRNLRTDLIGTGVRVTCIKPGLAETEFSKVRFKGDEETASQVYAGVDPLTAEDIAGIILWVSQQPTHVNINSLEVMCVNQCWGPLVVHREG